MPADALRRSSCSCVYVHAHCFSEPWFAGIPRYTVRLALALATHVPVHFFDGEQELLFPQHLNWSQDQDLEHWGRQIWKSRRQPLDTPPANSIGLYCAGRPSRRVFPYEVSILHDFCPMVVPWAFPDGARAGAVKFLTELILASDVVVSDSHSTKADAAWFSALDPDRIVVAPPGPSLCVKTHRHRRRVARSNRMALVVSTIEPRKNAAFLFDWFQKTRLLPPDMELWWVGKLGWMLSPEELQRAANPPGGRRVRFLGNVSDAQLCRLYQRAAWSIYPSRYEGFGFPILDSLRHGTPVLSSCTSSMGEFDHPGVFFFDPQDSATVDLAWQRLQAANPVTIPQTRLSELYDWDLVARAVLDAHKRDGTGLDMGKTRSLQPALDDFTTGQSGGSSLPSAVRGSRQGNSPGNNQNAGLRIGIELFGTQSASRNRGIGRYVRNLVTTLLSRDPDNVYVLYGQDGLPTDQFPRVSNSIVRLLQPDPTRGETTLAHVMERLTETNPDNLDVLLVLNPLELALGFDAPAKPLNGLKMVAVVYDLIPLLFQKEYFPRWPGPEYVSRYVQSLNRLRSYDALLAISEATRRDLISLLGLSPDRVVTIGAASNGAFFVPDRTNSMPVDSRTLLELLGITRPFVFSVGAVEYRKNVWGLIDAFAMLPDKLREAHQLVLTYSLSGPHRDQVLQYARDRAVADQLVMTDWLSDRALRVLYQRCAAFVFPSSYEGFGLPILEAMHCGSPVLAGNNSSQIEVVGDAGLLFNVASADELAAQLVQVLDNPQTSEELRERAVIQAQRFHWDKTADRTLEVLTRPYFSKRMLHPHSGRMRVPRRRIAFFSPLPPLPSGVSDYSVSLLDELKRNFTIDLYHDRGYVPHIGLGSPGFGCYDIRLFERNAAVLDYHALVYQMGNSDYHKYMYETLLYHPGVVTLHDLDTTSFDSWYGQQPDMNRNRRIRERPERFHLSGTEQVLRSLASGPDGPGRKSETWIQSEHHLKGQLLECASAVVVHSPWCAEQVECRFPGHLYKTFVIPFGATAVHPSSEQRTKIRARFGVPPESLIITSLEKFHGGRMNREVIMAFAPLARSIPEAFLIVVGDQFRNDEVQRMVMELGLQQRVRFLANHGAVTLNDLAAITDIGVCLRRPSTNHEASAELLVLLGLGVPTIVSEVGSFSCFPDTVVRKHCWDADGLARLSQALQELAEDQSRREALGSAAWLYIQQNHSWRGAANGYQEVIERTIAVRKSDRGNQSLGLQIPRMVPTLECFQGAM